MWRRLEMRSWKKIENQQVSLRKDQPSMELGEAWPATCLMEDPLGSDDSSRWGQRTH